MARRNKIIDLKLEDVVLAGKSAGETEPEITLRCNAELRKRGINDTVSIESLRRYLASIPQAIMPILHQPQFALENVHAIVNIGDRVQKSLERLDALLAIAEVERDRLGERQYAAIVALTAESRKQVTMYANLLDKFYNAQRIAIFQQAVVAAIEEADPETAERVRRNLRRHHEIRRASLLGA